MKRNNFLKAITASSVGATLLNSTDAKASIESKAAPKKTLMTVGCQSGGTTIENLEFKARHGVYNIDGGSPKTIVGKGWDLADSLAKKEACEKYGISLDAYHWPLTSAGIDKQLLPNIMLGKNPERDREIEMLQQMIQVAGKSGIKVLNYNTTNVNLSVDPIAGVNEIENDIYAEAADNELNFSRDNPFSEECS